MAFFLYVDEQVQRHDGHENSCPLGVDELSACSGVFGVPNLSGARMAVVGVLRESNVEHGEVLASAMHADFLKWQACHVLGVRRRVCGARRNWGAEGGAARRSCLALIHGEVFDFVVFDKIGCSCPFVFFSCVGSCSCGC